MPGRAEEPGRLEFRAPRIEDTVAKLGGKASPRYVGRPEYASTAAGLMKQHLAELAAFLNDALVALKDGATCDSKRHS